MGSAGGEWMTQEVGEGWVTWTVGGDDLGSGGGMDEPGSGRKGLRSLWWVLHHRL